MKNGYLSYRLIYIACMEQPIQHRGGGLRKSLMRPYLAPEITAKLKSHSQYTKPKIFQNTKRLYILYNHAFIQRYQQQNQI